MIMHDEVLGLLFMGGGLCALCFGSVAIAWGLHRALVWMDPDLATPNTLPDDGCCDRCRYDLAGLPRARKQRCPECGARVRFPAASPVLGVERV